MELSPSSTKQNAVRMLTSRATAQSGAPSSSVRRSARSPYVSGMKSEIFWIQRFRQIRRTDQIDELDRQESAMGGLLDRGGFAEFSHRLVSLALSPGLANTIRPFRSVGTSLHIPVAEFRLF